MAKLVLKDITKYFVQENTRIPCLNEINASFKQGETYAIIGTSGTGKSTLMHIIAGLDKPSSGVVYFNNRPLATLSFEEQNKFLNSSIGFMFQWPYLINELSVLENVIMPGLIAGKKQFHCEKRARTLLDQVGIADKAYHKPMILSGGQQQRVGLARALFNQPVFLLADEPTGNLDTTTGKEIVNLLLSCQQKWHMGIIVVSHAHYVAQAMETVYQLQTGKLIKKQKKDYKIKKKDKNSPLKIAYFQ